MVVFSSELFSISDENTNIKNLHHLEDSIKTAESHKLNSGEHDEEHHEFALMSKELNESEAHKTQESSMDSSVDLMESVHQEPPEDIKLKNRDDVSELENPKESQPSPRHPAARKHNKDDMPSVFSNESKKRRTESCEDYDELQKHRERTLFVEKHVAKRTLKKVRRNLQAKQKQLQEAEAKAELLKKSIKALEMDKILLKQTIKKCNNTLGSPNIYRLQEQPPLKHNQDTWGMGMNSLEDDFGVIWDEESRSLKTLTQDHQRMYWAYMDQVVHHAEDADTRSDSEAEARKEGASLQNSTQGC